MWRVQKWPNTKRGPESSAPAFRKETLSATLPPRSPTQPVHSILGLCVKLYRGVITAPLEKGRGGGVLREQEAGRCSCLNWATSTESEQPGNYATASNPFPWPPHTHTHKKKTANTGSVHLFTQGEKRALPKYAHESHHCTFYSHTFCPLTMLKLSWSPFM